MTIYHIINDSSNDIPSYIKIIDDKEKILVCLNGPMSMFAAGAFIKAQEEQLDSCLNIAMQHWKR